MRVDKPWYYQEGNTILNGEMKEVRLKDRLNMTSSGRVKTLW